MKTSHMQAEWFARIALGIIFIWFGLLKVVDASPANAIVHDLLDKTLPFIPFGGFIIFLGIWEAAIGVLYLFPKTTRVAFWLMAVQMFTTFGPLVLLTGTTWESALVPTLEGQYIIKNLIIIALGYSVYTHYAPRVHDDTPAHL